MNKSVRKVASHIPNVTSPEDEKPLPDGTIEVSAYLFHLVSPVIADFSQLNGSLAVFAVNFDL